MGVRDTEEPIPGPGRVEWQKLSHEKFSELVKQEDQGNQLMQDQVFVYWNAARSRKAGCFLATRHSDLFELCGEESANL